MDFFESQLVKNNLGGYCSPSYAASCKADEPYLYYANVGKLRVTPYTPDEADEVYKIVDLKVEVDPDSTYRAGDPVTPPGSGYDAGLINGWGKGQKFGEINLGGRAAYDFPGAKNADGTLVTPASAGTMNEATFIFTLIDQQTKSPVQGLEYFAFSYFDFDEDVGRNGQECIEIMEPVDKSQYDVKAGILVSPTGEWTQGQGTPSRFCSTGYGSRHDNPSQPQDMLTTAHVLNRALSLEFRDTNVMKVKYSVRCCIGCSTN